MPCSFRELERLEAELSREAELEAEKEKLERDLAEMKAKVSHTQTQIFYARVPRLFVAAFAKGTVACLAGEGYGRKLDVNENVWRTTVLANKTRINCVFLGCCQLQWR